MINKHEECQCFCREAALLTAATAPLAGALDLDLEDEDDEGEDPPDATAGKLANPPLLELGKDCLGGGGLDGLAGVDLLGMAPAGMVILFLEDVL